jgi:hypothetical protein
MQSGIRLTELLAHLVALCLLKSDPCRAFSEQNLLSLTGLRVALHQFEVPHLFGVIATTRAEPLQLRCLRFISGGFKQEASLK